MAEDMTITFTRYIDDENDPDYDPDCDVEVEEKVPGKYEVCGRCTGKGTHVNPAIDGHGITSEEFEQDPDFEEAYFGGVYDVPCYECKGKRVVLVVDEEKAKAADPEVWKHYQKHLATQRRIAAEERFEQHMRDMSGGEW